MDAARARQLVGRPVVALVASWTALDLLFNVRAPAPGRIAWALLPSIDATIILAAVAVAARAGRRLPPAATIAIGTFALLVRFLRVGDGITIRYFNRPFEPALDLPLASELVRLLQATDARALLLLAVAALIALLAAIVALAAWAVRSAERALRAPEARRAFLAIALLAIVVSPALPPGAPEDDRWGAFGRSVGPRLLREVAAWATLPERRAREEARVEARARAVAQRPHDLRGLRGAPVLVFLVESYGAAVADVPALAAPMNDVYAELAADLAAGGISVATARLASPTYAGRSWLAQQTLFTGVTTSDRVADAAVQRLRPVTMARRFREAGYHTVFAQPANRYPELVRWVYDFDDAPSGWQFGYRGPAFGWASMPDQLAIEVVHRRFVAEVHRPVFVAYALQSSHAPWARVPAIVEDWDALGDGAAYRTLPAREAQVGWTSLRDAGPAYVASLAYDLRVITRYVRDRAPRTALVLVLGDHQPVAEVTGGDPSAAVPVHVLTRDPALLAPFVARGYRLGLRLPPASASTGALADVFPGLLDDFSAAPRP